MLPQHRVSEYLLYQNLSHFGFDPIRISRAITVLLGEEHQPTREDDEERSEWLAEYDRRMDQLEREHYERYHNANVISPV